MFLLVAGVVGGGMATRNVLLTGVAGAIAGAVSMAAGEYMATKSQDEVFQGEIDLEREHIKDFKEDELHELRDLLEGIGLNGDLREEVVQHFNRDDEALLQVMTALEFGVLEAERRSATAAAVMSGVLFLLGSLPSVIPFAVAENPNTGLLAAAIGAVLGLLIVGAIKTWATRGEPLRAAVENLLIAGLGGGLAYWVGVGFDRLVNG
ncbi:MAG: VIT1/CCC1 transporter family protein, partial [Acidimicrobiia bacterium]|nr:VIT1/CCC1 transporter family protein [Acidimicrobiia bacterium]